MKISAIRIRGSKGIRKDIKDTLLMLRLYKKNYCVILDDKPINRGMINKVKDYIAYGEIDEDVLNILFENKSEKYTGKVEDKKGKIKYDRKFVTYNNEKVKKYFRLNPPRKGYGRKGIKKSFKEGGVLGYMGKEINNLIKRMV